MKLALIGVGQAGGKILDRFLWYDHATGSSIVHGGLAVNTARADLRGLDHLPVDRRLLIGQARVKGNGVGADNDLGAEIAEQDIDEIQGAIDDIPAHQIDAFLVIAALGGGTGSGGAPVIARHLNHIYTEPVYGLGILPARTEGGIYTLNAARSLQTFVNEVDNLLLFDNDAWRTTGESLEEGFTRINTELVRRFGVLFTAGDVDSGEHVGESIVDASEIINTLAGGGISAVGYARDEISRDDGLLSRFNSSSEPETTAATNRIPSLVRKATLGRLTLPSEVDAVERALVVAAGPPAFLSRKGIERGRRWLEEETGSMEVRGGDYPLPDEDHVAAAVLLSGLTDVPRVRDLQRAAVEAQDSIQAISDASADRLEDLVEDDDDELDPLF